MNREDFTRFETETAGVSDPIEMPIGEVIPPGGDIPIDDGMNEFASEFLTDDVVGELFSLPGSMMARKTGHEFWKMEDDEKCLLGKTIGPGSRYLVQKYLSGAAGPLALAAAGLSIVYGPRVLRERQEQQKETQGRTSTQQQQYSQSPQNSTAKSAASSVTGDMGNRPNSADFGVLSQEL